MLRRVLGQVAIDLRAELIKHLESVLAPKEQA